MTNTASPGSFYNQNAVVYTDSNPPGPADTPVTGVNTEAPSSFYKGTGGTFQSAQYPAGISPFSPIPHYFLTGLNGQGTFSVAQPAFSDISGKIEAAQIINGLVNVVDFGAVIDGVTDNTAVVQAAINSLNGPGMVLFPVGTCVVKSGVTLPLGVVLAGIGNPLMGSACSVLSSGNADATVVTMSGGGNGLQNLFVLGAGFQAGTTVPTTPAVLVSSSDCFITFTKINGGKYALQNTVGDLTIIDSKIGASYGSAAFYSIGGFYSLRNKYNRSWPGVTPAAGTTFNAWSVSSPIVGAVVSLGGFLIQCTTGGVTGGSAPALLNYGTAIQDGTAVWQLVAPTTYYGKQIVNGIISFAHMDDHSGAYTAGVLISGTTGQTSLSQCDFSYFIQTGVWATGGNGLNINNSCQFSGGISPTATGVLLDTGWGGNANISDNVFSGGAYGVQNNTTAGGNTIDRNVIGACTQWAISNCAGALEFTNNNNKLGGVNANCIQVVAGVSNFYSIMYNDVQNCTGTAISDGGSGTRKTVQDSNGQIRLSALSTQNNQTIVGNVSGSIANPVALTGAQVCSILGLRQGTTPASPYNPTGTASTSRVMMGCAVSVTPQTTGNLLVLVSASAANSVAGDGTSTRITYGTPFSGAPINGAAETGTVGSQASNTTSPTAAAAEAINVLQFITGLTVGTTYWFDVSLKAATGGTATLSNVAFTFIEL